MPSAAGEPCRHCPVVIEIMGSGIQDGDNWQGGRERARGARNRSRCTGEGGRAGIGGSGSIAGGGHGGTTRLVGGCMGGTAGGAQEALSAVGSK